MSESVSNEGRYRAARAAKKLVSKEVSDSVLEIFGIQKNLRFSFEHTCDLSFFVRQRNFQNFKLYAKKCVNSQQ